MSLENAMASEMPPTTPPEAGYAVPEDYEFDLDDELEGGNEFVDEVLTRVGELALDTIEAIQEHPVLAASLLAAGVGAVAGLVAAKIAPRRRPPTVTEQAAAGAASATALAAGIATRAAEAVAAARLGSRLSETQEEAARRLGATQEEAARRLSATQQGAARRWFATRERLGSRLADTPERSSAVAEGAGERAREGSALGQAALAALAAMGLRAGERARHAAEDVRHSVGRDGSHDVAEVVAEKGERARYLLQLLPLALALLRNPIVRDLLAHAIANRMRRTAHL
jgi:hypothetical protein